MEYKKLTQLTNTYPQPGNYITTEKDIVTLYGIYDSINKREFTTEDLSRLKVVDGTTFKFILSIKVGNRAPELYTSKFYYALLESSKTESNPYFVNFSFKDVYVIDYTIDSVTYAKFEEMVSAEKDVGVNMKTNNFIDYNKEAGSSSIDYIKLVKYIDWAVSSPKLEEVDTDNVIPAEKLGIWEVSEIQFDYANQDVKEVNTGNPGSGGATGAGGSGPTTGGGAGTDTNTPGVKPKLAPRIPIK
jgi:hypothetical protein